MLVLLRPPKVVLVRYQDGMRALVSTADAVPQLVFSLTVKDVTLQTQVWNWTALSVLYGEREL